MNTGPTPTASSHVYIALSQFCENDDAPRRLLQSEGLSFAENLTGRRPRADELIAAARSVIAVVAGVEPYDAVTLQALPALKCISRCGVGVDSIDMDAARRLGIAVFTTPDPIAEPVAELTVSMILALARRLPEAMAAQREGQWRRRTGFLLSEWTVGLVGFGRVGQAVERYLRPFGPAVCVADPALDRSDRLPPGVSMVDLNTLLSRADVVSIHAARSAADAPLIGAAEIAKMKPGSRIVNTSRGYLLDEAALCEGLKTGQLSGAALDVFADEPYSGPLLSFPQVLCTPHIGTLTRASRIAMELQAVENVITFLKG